MSLSPELTALRHEAMAVSCESWAIQKRWALRRAGADLVGPCPVCGGDDRFGINRLKNLFNCRKCEISGEGVISLVMATEGVLFVRACEIITGRQASDPVDEKKAEENRRRAEADARRREKAESDYREKARGDGHAIWKQGRAFDLSGGVVIDYLARRAIDIEDIDPALLRTLRSHPDLPWTEEWVNPDTGNKGWRTLHSGPAMLAAVQLPDDRFGAVHMTWLDLAQPRGKLVLPNDEAGKPRVAKKVRGTKKGGAMRLFSPPGARRIVMGEGIETTLTPLVHAREPHTAYWAGVDIGNMAGRALRVAHSGSGQGQPQGGTLIHEQPDMDDLECFLVPDWCEELVYLGEGDEASVHSREKCLRGLLRNKRVRAERIAAGAALKPLSTIYVPPAEAGKDMNDLAIEELTEARGNAPAGGGAGVAAD